MCVHDGAGNLLVFYRDLGTGDWTSQPPSVDPQGKVAPPCSRSPRSAPRPRSFVSGT